MNMSGKRIGAEVGRPINRYCREDADAERGGVQVGRVREKNIGQVQQTFV